MKDKTALETIADQPGPLLVKEEFGREPSLREMIEMFYESRLIGGDYKKLSDDYIKNHGN